MIQTDAELERELLRRRDQRAIGIQTWGLDDYETSLKLDISAIAKKCLDERKTFTWYDMCCGEFKAGSTIAQRLTADDQSCQGRVKICGVDLLRGLDRVIKKLDGVSFKHANAATYVPEPHANLITCHYGAWMIYKLLSIQGVLGAIDNWFEGLAQGGLLAFNFTQGGAIQSCSYLTNKLKETYRSSLTEQYHFHGTDLTTIIHIRK